MRRLFLPAVVLAVVIVASVLAGRANDAADPGDGSGATTEPALSTPLFSARRAPEWLRQPTTDSLLENGVTAALSAVPVDTPHCLAVHRGGDPVARVNAGAALIPGEVQRLTTIAAFEPDAAGFTTEVVRDRDDAVEDGVLQGDLYLIGGADPVLSNPAFIERFGDDRASTSLPTLAADTVKALADIGITAVAGNVIGVDLKYQLDLVSNADAWTAEEIASNVVGVTDGLLVDNGFEAYDPDMVDPGARRRAGDAQIHAAESFARWLTFFGLPTAGVDTGAGPEATNLESVSSIDSPPMVDIARRALVDATTAEMLYRELAVRNAFNGVLPVGGFFAVRNSLVGVPPGTGIVPEDEVGNVPAIDGSGLSLQNRARCDVLALTLDGALGSLAPDALAGLGAASVAACAPTGLESLDVVASARPEVTAIAGSATASNGDVITFSLIVNWVTSDDGTSSERGLCDDVVPAVLDAIAAHPGGPDLEDLAPLPVVIDG